MSDEQINRQRDIFHKIFIKMHQEEHYNMMMRPTTKEGESYVNAEEG